MSDKITAEGQTEQDAPEMPLTANDVLAGTFPPHTVRFADREKARLAVEKVFRLHARLFEELAK